MTQKERSHRWYLRHKEESRQHTNDWRKENPEKEAMTQKKSRRKSRIIMHELKINGCAICGYDKCDSSLDFHHSNPEDKKFLCGVNDMMRHSKNYINEVNKCILLCRNCHGEITELERASNF